MPVTFRLNTGEPNIQRVSHMLKDPNFVKQFVESKAVQEAAALDGKEEEEAKDEEEGVRTESVAVTMD